MKYIYALICLLFLFKYSYTQLKINEVCTNNKSILFDEDYDAKSWFELYNNSTLTINLSNYYISDKRNNLTKFRLPDRNLAPNDFQLIYASSKNKGAYEAPITTHHWETAVKQGDFWRYVVSSDTADPTWRELGFDDASWPLGKSGIGYGDGDDSTIVPNCFAVYMRYSFSIPDTSKIINAILNMDYDDGFVVYLNGVEISRANMWGSPPAWNETAYDHEANLYTGASAPETFFIDRNLLKRTIRNGTNDIAIQVHNTDTTSSDLTSIPTLSFLVENGSSFFPAPPSWFSFVSTVYAGNIHSNFQLANSGEILYLSNLSSSIIDSMVAGNTNPNESRGRYTDGINVMRYFDNATPGYSNNSSTPYIGIENKPTILLQSAVYGATQTATILNNSTTSGVIRYTLNGQDPTSTSPIYTSPLSISNTTILKARAFNTTNYLPSFIDAKTYLFNEDYTVPIYSITADSTDLFGWSGIIDNPWSNYRVPCHIDIFDIDNSLIASQKSSIRIDGGAGGSRGNPQRSFRMDFDNANFGDGVINSVLIPDKPHVDKYASIYLRNGSNFWNNVFFKEAFMERVSRADTFAIYNAYRPVVVLLNGEYFGLYELREKYTDDYLKNNYGANKDSVDILSVSYSTGPGVIRTLEGSDLDWFTTHGYIMSLDTTDPNFLRNANRVLDVKNFANYMTIENYWANYDWIWNNMKFLRMRNLDNRWKFALQDMEWGLAGWGNYWDNMFGYMDGSRGYTYVDIYFKLLENRSYRNFFINRYADLLNSDMLPDTAISKLDAMWDEAIPEWDKQILRWQDSDTNNIVTHISEFNDIRNTFKEFINLRTDFVQDQIIDVFNLEKEVNITLRVNPPGAGNVRISTITAPYYPWSGVYFDGNSVDLEAHAYPSYEFSHWDTSEFISDTLAIDFKTNINRDATFTANYKLAPVDTNTSVFNAIQSDFEVSIFPNPSDNISYINMSSPGEKMIQIISATGAVIDTRKTFAQIAQISTKDLAKGLYVINISFEGKLITKKLIVN
jgi:hypothetical protein